VLVVVALVCVGACTSTKAKVAAPSSAASTTTEFEVEESPAGCIFVNSSTVISALGASVGAVEGDETFGTGKKVYYLAYSSGALWVTNSDPADDESALVLPLNAAARAASETAADVPAGAPIYGNASAESRGAKLAIECAKGAK
jgi:hypothetical protein